jgi:CIC family chloride channel protein
LEGLSEEHRKNLKESVTHYIREIAVDIRGFLLPAVYGLCGGLAAVAFQSALNITFSTLWQVPSQQMGHSTFAFLSLLTMVVTSISASLILMFVSCAASGSGIPQVMVAYWKDFGCMPAKVVIAKFFAGVLSIGGGCSLGREGPTVHLAGALTSSMAGWLSVAKQARRPALLCGSAAGLAGAFNTPLSAIAFVLEQISLNDRGFLAQVLVASASATFVAHTLLGENPAFAIPAVSHISVILYPLVIPTAGLAALVGAAFQNGTLAWRAKIKRLERVPFFLKAAIGALINWIFGITVFFAIARIGVFGLGYGDLEKMLGGGVTGSQATVLLIAKLAATIAVYAWGGVGGIFSPTLFFGAAVGLVFGDLGGFFLHLEPGDRIALTVAGMSACFGAVVRAPITSILIVFEMTHQFSLVPLLMIGTIASQAVSRSFCRTDFYNGVIEQDGIELERFINSRSIAYPQERPVSAAEAQDEKGSRSSA